MRRTALLAAAVAVSALGLAAPAATACTGPVCETFCEVQTSKPVVKVTGEENCLVK